MKRIITILITLVLIASNVNSQNLSQEKKNDFELFTAKLCVNISLLKGSGNDLAGQVIEDYFLRILKITRETKDYKLKIAEFWNKYNDRFICTHKTMGLRTPQHWMKRVVDLRMYGNIFYDFLLYDEEEYPINVNAVEMYNGKGETLLDYLDDILADSKNEDRYDFKEIQMLRRIIIRDYGAKKAYELKN